MKGTRTTYEWDIETWEDDDVTDHHHAEHMDAEHNLLAMAGGVIHSKGVTQRLVLVRDVWSDWDGCIDRQWAYVERGVLPYQFTDGLDREDAKVPQRFHKVLARVARNRPE